MMDRFTRFHSSYGCKVNPSCLIPILLAFSLVQDPGFRPSHFFPRFPVRPLPLPAHPYLHATLRFRQHSSSTFVVCSLTLQMYVSGSLGTPPSAVIWGALPLKLFVMFMFLSNAMPSLAFGGLICRAWCKRLVICLQQSRLMWGRPRGKGRTCCRSRPPGPSRASY